MSQSPIYYFTANVKGMTHILKDDELKEMLLTSVRLTVEDGDITVFGYCVMPNHFHLIWSMSYDLDRKKVENSILDWTSQKFRTYFVEKKSMLADEFKSEDVFVPYSVWKDDVESIEITNKKDLQNRLNYIHANPCKGIWMLVDSPDEYQWSSAALYSKNEVEGSFVTNISKANFDS